LEQENVTLKMIEDNGGMTKRAYTGIDTSSQGALRCKLRAELRQPAQREMRDIYKYLTPKMQEAFALAWGTERDWKFLTELKATELMSETVAGKRRAWKTVQGIADKIGSCLVDTCMEQAYSWADSCWNFEDPSGENWVRWNGNLGTYEYMYEWTIEEENEIERLSVKSEMSKSTNLFKEAAFQRKAILNYAERHGVTEAMVCIEDVKKHKLGIQGWADAGEPSQLPGRQQGGGGASAASAARGLSRGGSEASDPPKKKGRAKAKGKGKAKAKTSAAKVKVGDVERELKKVVPSIDKKIALDQVEVRFKGLLKSDAKFHWAESMVTEMTSHLEKLSIEDEALIEDIQILRASEQSLSKALLASRGEESVRVLIKLQENLSEILQLASPCADRINRMKNNSTLKRQEASETPEPKKRRKPTS